MEGEEDEEEEEVAGVEGEEEGVDHMAHRVAEEVEVQGVEQAEAGKDPDFPLTDRIEHLMANPARQTQGRA